MLSWMAWTWPTALFFICIFASIAAMGVWEYYVPGGNPRHGIFGLDTTRGDRLFMSILGGCFIMLAWLGLVGTALWIGFAVCLVWAVFIYRFA
jgi:predicted small integral membrane protein